MVLTNSALLIDIPLPFLDASAFIERMLTLGQCNLAFYQVAFPVEFRAHTGVSLLLDGRKNSCQFLLMQEQFARAGRVGDNV